ncbi:MAG: fasciclin domain-containing protein [Ignavibacteriae bacterium]|nr:fasciclin domain-containing protein [Ignavibacteriota bacterium]NOG99211.1 fasciclin domain-containing protein [Ignavibacteriota bacterium]
MKTLLNKSVFAAVVILLSASLLIAGGHKSEKHSKKDIVETALAAGSFTTLATALTEADLVSALQGEGPFTVFAPTDEAFAKLPEGTLESLLNDKDALKNILLYHVVSGKVSSEQVVKIDAAETLAGSKVNIKVKDGGVMINNSNVTTADVYASNGVIHVIDTVLLPPSK